MPGGGRKHTENDRRGRARVETHLFSEAPSLRSRSSLVALFRFPASFLGLASSVFGVPPRTLRQIESRALAHKSSRSANSGPRDNPRKKHHEEHHTRGDRRDRAAARGLPA